MALLSASKARQRLSISEWAEPPYELVGVWIRLTSVVTGTTLLGEAVLQVPCIVLRVADTWAVVRRTSCLPDRSGNTACLLQNQSVSDKYRINGDLLHKQAELQLSRSVPKPAPGYETISWWDLSDYWMTTSVKLG